jgi:hypothetical protein
LNIIHEKQIAPRYKAFVHIDNDEFVVSTKHVMFPIKEHSRHAREPDAIRAMVAIATEKEKRIGGLVKQLKPLVASNRNARNAIKSFGAEGLIELLEKARGGK